MFHRHPGNANSRGGDRGGGMLPRGARLLINGGLKVYASRGRFTSWRSLACRVAGIYGSAPVFPANI